MRKQRAKRGQSNLLIDHGLHLLRQLPQQGLLVQLLAQLWLKTRSPTRPEKNAKSVDEESANLKKLQTRRLIEDGGVNDGRGNVNLRGSHLLPKRIKENPMTSTKSTKASIGKRNLALRRKRLRNKVLVPGKVLPTKTTALSSSQPNC